MAYGIALALDEALGEQVRQLWRQFEAAGVGKTPAQFDEPPHITFSIFPSGNPAALAELVEATPITDTGVRLIPFGVFLGDRHTLYYSAILSPGLLQAHARHYELIRERNIEYDPTYAPGNVLFHCTMAVEVEAGAFLQGVDICVRNPQILQGSVERIELFEFFPLKPIHRRILEPSGSAPAPLYAGSAEPLPPEDAFRQILQRHAARYPRLGIQDLYKLIHQAAYGSAHAVADAAQAGAWLQREVAAPAAGPEEPAVDPISADGQMVRVNLRPYVAAGGDLEALLEAFIRTAHSYQGTEAQLRRYWGYAEKMAAEGALGMDVNEMRDFWRQMEGRGFPAVHHTKEYRETYRPAYRVVVQEHLARSIALAIPEE